MQWTQKLVTVGVIVLIVGCSATYQASDVQPSGFLGDYSKLRPGGKGDPLLFYQNPAADFRAYDKVIIEPVTIWRQEHSDLGVIPQHELQHLATLLEAKIIEAVKFEGLKVVREPGPRVLRIRAAITEAEQSNVKMDAFATALPLPGFSKMATGTRAFVGRAAIEGEMTDSQTGEVLMAGVDRREGARTPEGVRNPWDDVEKAFQYWSDRFRQRLCEERLGEYCVPAE